MITANDLYAMTPESVSRDPRDLAGFYYNHVPEIENLSYLEFQHSDYFEIRTLKHFCYDGRRIWKLATVWFDGYPVMVIQNAGREGDDHSRRFITDEGRYHDMVRHLRSLIVSKGVICLPELLDPDQDQRELIEFYGQGLNDPFHHY